ncbi:MAG: hypothetical protein HY220_02495 [Candidatus Sungbacteria bacterium]|uniref:Uncharacterized protein n=1 Tax=Candidatus Sungiibacteriota bacterium TaxID=2750080 RepID=A0A9D6LR93_9BACT|nr:hypothetical protein [Candidatus Sungbacteria bacterium]
MKTFLPNLLPPSVKDETRFVIVRHLAVRLSIVAACGIIMYSVFLIPSFFLLKFQLDEIQRQVALVDADPKMNEVSAINGGLVSANASVSALKRALATSTSVYTAMGAVASQATPGIHVQFISYDRPTRTMSLAANAAVRQDLLAFQSRLAALPVVLKIDSPITNLVKESNVDFQLKISFK